MTEPKLCQVDDECCGEAFACRAHYDAMVESRERLRARLAESDAHAIAAIRERNALAARLAEAEALLLELREGLDEHWVTTDIGKDAVARLNAFLGDKP